MGIYDRYKEWVRRHNDSLTLFETGLSSVTWFLPDRFSDSELGLEALHTGINLLSSFHEHILNEREGEPELPEPGAGTAAALSALQQSQVLVEVAAIWGERNGYGDRFGALTALEAVKALLRLEILRRTEARTLLDGGLRNPKVAAFRGAGRDAKAANVFKAFAQFRARHCAVVGAPQQATDDEKRGGKRRRRRHRHRTGKGVAGGGEEGGAERAVAEEGAEKEAAGGKDGAKKEVADGKREGGEEKEGSPVRIVGFAGKAGDSDAAGAEGPSTPTELFWDRPVRARGSALTRAGVVEAGSRKARAAAAAAAERALARLDERARQRALLVRRLALLGELFHIARPVVHAAQLRRHGRRSWRPWLWSLGCDAAADALAGAASRAAALAAVRAAADARRAGADPLAAAHGARALAPDAEEVAERARRRAALLWYLLRDPIFGRYTRPALWGAKRGVSFVPGLDWVSTRLLELLDGIQRYYTYVCAN